MVLEVDDRGMPTIVSHTEAKFDRSGDVLEMVAVDGIAQIQAGSHRAQVHNQKQQQVVPDASPAPAVAQSSALQLAGQRGERTSVVSGFVLVSVLGDFGEAEVSKTDERLISGGLERALADMLELCQPAVRVVGVHTVETQSVVELLQRAQLMRKQQTLGVQYSFVDRLNRILRRSAGLRVREQLQREHQEITVKVLRVVYEVQIFAEMQMLESTVVRRIDRLQAYSRFADLANALAHVISEQDPRLGALVSLDDVGRAAPRIEERPVASREMVATCVEEGLLRRARWTHQLVLLASILLVVMTLWAGSSIFAMKQPSVVPSRLNPLLRQS